MIPITIAFNHFKSNFNKKKSHGNLFRQNLKTYGLKIDQSIVFWIEWKITINYPPFEMTFLRITIALMRVLILELIHPLHRTIHHLPIIMTLLHFQLLQTRNYSPQRPCLTYFFLHRIVRIILPVIIQILPVQLLNKIAPINTIAMMDVEK